MKHSQLTDLIVGVGSAHGDDQAGWRLVDILIARNSTSAKLHKASAPHEMIDWLDGCQCLHVVDACDGRPDVLRLDISAGHVPDAIETRCSTSHQIGVGAVVELAKSLNLLPRRVMLWAIPGESFDPDGEIGDGCRRQVERCADLIEQESTMHERSLVQSLIGQVESILAQQADARATRIEVSIGPLSGVEPSLVSSAFEQLAPASQVAGAQLTIHNADLEATCRQCNESFIVEGFRFRCTACGSPSIQITSGDEFRLLQITVEEPCNS